MEVVKAPDNNREEQLTRWVECYQKRLLDLCYMVLQDRELARDAVQDTFLKAWQGMNRFHQSSSELTWLTTIALHTCHDMKHSSWAKHEKRDISPEEVLRAVPDGFRQETLDLSRAILQLPDKLKEPILLYYFQRMTMAEIAHAVGITKSLVSKRIKKAHALLRDMLGKEYLHE